MFAIAMLAALAGAGPAWAQDPDPVAARLSAEKAGDIETGDYSAGDNRIFSLDPYGDKYLLRFADNPETYVLYGDRIALGGRELKYDSGSVALKISVWGGVTLYTESAPAGLPATRIGDSTAPPHPIVSQAALTAALGDEESHLSYVQQLRLRFSTDAAILAGNDDARAMAFDTLVNAENGIEHVVAAPVGRAALTRKFDSVKIVEGDKPTILLTGKTLLVSFVPAAGPVGRASSRAITFALGKLLAISEPS